MDSGTRINKYLKVFNVERILLIIKLRGGRAPQHNTRIPAQRAILLKFFQKKAKITVGKLADCKCSLNSKESKCQHITCTILLLIVSNISCVPFYCVFIFPSYMKYNYRKWFKGWSKVTHLEDMKILLKLSA